MKPIVSIVIPVYNKKEYISDCIGELLNQEYDNYEIVIVDDGSTDGSEELLDRILKENQNKSIQVYHQKNQGVGVARNIGMSLSKGDWIWFVDADDIPSSEWLSSIKTYFECEQYDVIFSDYVKVFPDNKEEVIRTSVEGEIDKNEFPCLYMELQYKTGYFGYLWCKLLRKSFIEKCQATFIPGLTLAEDLRFLISLYENEPRCIFTSDLAYKYTIDANNSSKDKKIDYRAQLKIHYVVYLWMKNTYYFEKYEVELKKHISYYVAFVFYYGYETDHALSSEFDWWVHHPEYKVCLDSKQMNGIMKLLVFLLKRDMKRMIRFALRTREILRSFYRKVKRI